MNRTLAGLSGMLGVLTIIFFWSLSRGESNQVQSENGAPVRDSSIHEQEGEAWDLNNVDQLTARLLDKVRADGVIRIKEYFPSSKRDQIVFVGEYDEQWRFVPSQDHRQQSDLWLINTNGTGLRQLTADGFSYEPAWAPSGMVIAFVDEGSVKLLDIRSNEQSKVLDAIAQDPDDLEAKARGFDYLEYHRPKWSPDGKYIAALASTGSTVWVDAATGRGQYICRFADGAREYDWNSESELILNYGKFIFDFKLIQDLVAEPEPDTVGGEANNRFSNSLLEMVKRDGVERIEEYAISPLGDRLVFVGSFLETTVPATDLWKPVTDLWIVKLDGTDLRRLTYDRCNYVPAWSPSGNEIAFGHNDSVNVIAVRTGRERSLPGLHIYIPPEGRNAHRAARYLRPNWSPNGKVIVSEGTSLNSWVTAVEAKSGKLIFRSSTESGDYAWNQASELIIRGCGTFVFDWDQRGPQ